MVLLQISHNSTAISQSVGWTSCECVSFSTIILNSLLVNILASSAHLCAWYWAGVFDCVGMMINRSLSIKIQETGVIIFVRKHFLSDQCKSISWTGKLHATLLIICVTNVTKYYFLQSLSLQLNDKHTSIFIIFYLYRSGNEHKKHNSAKIRGKHWKTIFVYRICSSQRRR